MATYLGATGIAVADLERSSAFYTRVLGMVVLQTIELPTMKQFVLGFEGVRGASVLLMQYTDGRNPNCEEGAAKFVFYVPDAKAMLEVARDAGHVIHLEAAEFPSMGGAIIGFVKDPDGYLVELIQKPVKK